MTVRRFPGDPTAARGKARVLDKIARALLSLTPTVRGVRDHRQLSRCTGNSASEKPRKSARARRL